MGRGHRHFSRGDIQMTKRHLKRFSMALIIREMQIKTTVRYHLTPVRMAILKKSTNSKRWPGLMDPGYTGLLCITGFLRQIVQVEDKYNFGKIEGVLVLDKMLGIPQVRLLMRQIIHPFFDISMLPTVATSVLESRNTVTKTQFPVKLPVILMHWSPEQPRNPFKALSGPLIFLPCSFTLTGITSESQQHSWR